jgi:hypothetical protein
MLKHASEVTLVAENIFFLKIFNFVRSFVECKVSLADGKSSFCLLSNSDHDTKNTARLSMKSFKALLFTHGLVCEMRNLAV